MSDPFLLDAIQEAYASAPTEQIVHETLEIHHTGFVAPIRVVRALVDLSARLEASAPENGGEYVTFLAYNFRFVKPERGTSGAPQATIVIDNINSAIYEALHDAAMSGAKLTVYYREYLDTDLTQPQTSPPWRFIGTAAEVDMFKASLTIMFDDLMNRALGKNTVYTEERFPGLRP